MRTAMVSTSMPGSQPLASYLGHVSPSSTYWYLTASPELLDIVAQRVETHRRDYSS